MLLKAEFLLLVKKSRMVYYLCKMRNIIRTFFYVLQLLHSIIGENRRGNTSSDLSVHFVGGGLAGITAASLTYPLDLVRTRLAAQVMLA